jgi:hypothetical protein
MSIYGAIRSNVPGLDPNASYETNLECLRKQYEMPTLIDCEKHFEIDKKIDLNELFYGNTERVKNFSDVLAEKLESYFFDQHLKKSELNLSPIFSSLDIQNLNVMLRQLYEKLNITNAISEIIRRHADGYRNIEQVYEMIADISAEMVNKFINSVGNEYYTESNLRDLVKASENINGLSWNHDELQFKHNSKTEVAELIIKMSNLPELLNRNPLPKEELKLLPNYRNYFIWYDLLKAGFVTVSGVPNYDPIANEKLSKIINECQVVEY